MKGQAKDLKLVCIFIFNCVFMLQEKKKKRKKKKSRPRGAS